MFNLPPLCLHLAAMCTHFVTISNITYSPISLVFFFSFFHCVVTCDKDVNHIFFIHPSTVWILRSMFVSVSVSCFCLSSTLLQMCCNRHANYFIIIIIIIIYPLSARVIGAPQMVLQPVFSIFPCSPLPCGTCRTPGLSIPWCCLPTASFVRLVFFPLSLCLARWFWLDLFCLFWCIPAKKVYKNNNNDKFHTLRRPKVLVACSKRSARMYNVSINH